ncbi:amino acid ABC transporter substrate-binding protein [Candidatus Spongiihabitans sp.]|uniref:amino acid ABC transporter substrate-binding protein n=1 Tax=Candidatus Spongiihabitans sp. TaxID=3101308 RepID=UPI003C7038E7
MKLPKIAALATALSLTAITASAGTLQDVQARDELNCIISTGLIGFAAPDENGRWEGVDVDLCRAVAAAVLGYAEKVKFIPATTKNRFTVLNSGEADILFRNTTETMSRDTDLKLTFLPINYYDGQGFLIRKDLGITSAKDLDGASVCIQTGTTTELNLADFFRTTGISYEPVAVETNEEGITNYNANRCDAYTTDASALASIRVALENPSGHIILPEIISKEPLGGAVRQGDDQWADIGKWVVNAVINAEELGVTQANVKQLASAPGDNPSINRLLGTESNMGEMLGLDNAWAVRAISASGNYGESFDRHIGPNTTIGLARGLNALWKDGGILYAAPIR